MLELVSCTHASSSLLKDNRLNLGVIPLFYRKDPNVTRVKTNASKGICTNECYIFNLV